MPPVHTASQSSNARQYASLGPNAPIIAAAAIAHGLDPRVALAVAHGEGGFADPTPIGDNGTSFGPFQLHQGGALPAVYDNDPRRANAWANSPAGINYAVQRIAAVTRGMQGQAAIDAAVRDFERPANPTPEVTRDTQFYNSLVAGRQSHPIGGPGRDPGAGLSGQGGQGGSGGFPTAAGSSPGVAPQTVPNVFDSCHLTTSVLGFIPVPSGGGMVCYATGVLKVTALALGGVVMMGVGFYLVLPRFRAAANRATGGAAGAIAAQLPAARAEKVASAAAASSAGATRQRHAERSEAIGRAKVSRERARAREARAKARTAEYHAPGKLRLSGAQEAAISRAQSKPAKRRPDRVS